MLVLHHLLCMIWKTSPGISFTTANTEEKKLKKRLKCNEHGTAGIYKSGSDSLKYEAHKSIATRNSGYWGGGSYVGKSHATRAPKLLIKKFTSIYISRKLSTSFL